MDESNPSPKRLRGKQKQKAAVPPKSATLSDDDHQALTDFCRLATFEETSFESWQNTHTDLDLHVPIWVSQDLAKNGGEALVRCSRSIKSGQSNTKPIRQPISLNVPIPPGTSDGSRLTLPGIGDQDAEKVGNLIVIVHLK